MSTFAEWVGIRVRAKPTIRPVKMIASMSFSTKAFMGLAGTMSTKVCTPNSFFLASLSFLSASAPN